MSETPDTENPIELNLDEVVETSPEEITEEQKSFLEQNKDKLTPDQLGKFGITKEEEAELNLDEIEPEVRETRKEKPKEKVVVAPEDNEEIDPDDEKTIGKVVNKQLSDVREQLEEMHKLKDESDVNAFIMAKPEFSKYRAPILKYLSHPAYKNIPVHNIAAIVASKDLLKLGAQKEREAIQKAKDTQGGGNSVRKSGTTTDWLSVSKEEFENQKARVMGRSGS